MASSSSDGNSSHDPPMRRRRMLSRRTIGDESPPTLNPRAADFVPSTRSPSKRKLSLVMNSGRATMSHLKHASAIDRQRDPIIRADELSGNAGDSTAAVLFQGIKGEDLHRSKPKYLPLTPYDGEFRILSSARLQMDLAMIDATNEPLRVVWRPDKLPVEMFELITEHLPRDDIKAMRLVNREFEEKVSLSLFRTAVVPFNTELYDMIDEDVRATIREPGATGKGKGRARDAQRIGIKWQNATTDHDDKVYKGHGLRVFQGFGRHIRRFGMSFEVSEEQMGDLPVKKDLETHQAYHGEYEWPPSQYARFANLAGLERTADETSRMRAAFSNLTGVQELGLSIDSGLGWLNGPDRSVHSQVFRRPTQIFDASVPHETGHSTNARNFWDAMEQSVSVGGLNAGGLMKEQVLCFHNLPNGVDAISGLRDSPYRDPALWPTLGGKRSSGHGDSHSAVAFTSGRSDDSSYTSVIPSTLRKEHKEWLLETEWAQRAFLESYMLAITDNYVVFNKVTKLSIAKISSGLLNTLSGEHFWSAMPKLTDITICVSPDWRTVHKDQAGYVQAPSQHPSEAVRIFQEHVLDRISQLPMVKRLRFGFTDSGEHAQGIFARNNNLLPAPIVPLAQSVVASPSSMLRFRHVEHLTLVNCWATPPMLEQLVSTHANESLKTLTLESVSLTTHPRFPTPAHAGQPNQQPVQQWHAQLALLQMAGPNGVAANVQQLTAHQIQVIQTIAQQQQQLQQGSAAGQAALLGHPYVQNVIANLGNAPLNGMGGNPALTAFLANPLAAGAVQGGPLQALLPLPPWQNNTALAGAPAASNTNSHWATGHHHGSWPDVIDRISPGTILRDHLPPPPPWETPWPERASSTLKRLEFVSCGYAKLANNTHFDQSRFDSPEFAAGIHEPSPWFRARQRNLSASMLETRQPYHGKIVQCLPTKESNTLLLAWGLTEGWDNASESAEAPEHDGFLPGGTGRFSGVVQAEDV